MEKQIEIKPTTSVEELLQIIMNNEPEDVAKAFAEYNKSNTNSWWSEYSRANKAEKELAEIKDKLAKYALEQLENIK